MTHDEFTGEVLGILRKLTADIEAGRVVAESREEGPYEAAWGPPRKAHRYFTLIYSVEGEGPPAGGGGIGTQSPHVKPKSLGNRRGRSPDSR